MQQPLTEVEVRVLGSLVEKEATTPDNYPLSLNALTNACNQTSNRDPVMHLEEPVVAGALDTLRRQSLVRAIQPSHSRVMKYRHLLGETMELTQRELAVLCVLMLRGPQTVGELRTRTDRLAEFADLGEVERTLEGLIERQAAALVARLPPRRGQKEQRYAHLLSGEPAVESDSAPVEAPVGRAGDRVAALESTVEELRGELAELRREFERFREQF